ncbi:hypothetical protein LEP1GSC193_3816 [Leptospira alstonii serovar Pingchang str. 80-412]|uniref:Uncharacterized protein n=2 Tax=Leptospira alstonii TaxID=28452 RepID=M6DB23_9LEPT|nr:hypothetical protein LEP1GSC194_3084 [Leptospira alstonii serovar Sichuan str. 79601]EQA80743.1 hypothetical protein LEP1GSC193_3816 [Leptospira alstonii serovar Pingchang str. 80-412]
MFLPPKKRLSVKLFIFSIPSPERISPLKKFSDANPVENRLRFRIELKEKKIDTVAILSEPERTLRKV